MKLKTTLVLGLSVVAANAVTNVTLQNFDGTNGAFPIVDNAGDAVDTGLVTLQVGSFTDAFAGTLGSLDTETSDAAVIDAFAPSGDNSLSFSFDGLFNGAISVDGDNSLGAAGADLYALVTYTPAVGGPQALVFNFGGEFPDQVGGADQTVNIGRILTVDDVAFGGDVLVPVNADTLPGPLSAFDRGITFDRVPEPSTGLLSLVAGLGLLARRRR